MTPLHSSQEFTQLVLESGIATWEELLLFVKRLPYGRNADRSDFKLVLTEGKGSCSSKHAFLKIVAEENEIHNVELILAIYKMNGGNTKGVSSVLDSYQIGYIPEAHCYLRVNGSPMDLTSESSHHAHIAKDVLTEEVIQPNDVIQYKVDAHKIFVQQWLKNSELPYSFNEIWSIREECIQALSN